MSFREETHKICFSCRLGEVLKCGIFRHFLVADAWMYLFSNKGHIHEGILAGRSSQRGVGGCFWNKKDR